VSRRARAVPAPSSDPEIEARIASLEAERWRTFEEAQREADTMFARYQLSQLLALGATVAGLADAVLDELIRDSEATSGALWLASPGETFLRLVAATGEAPFEAADHGARPAAPIVPVRFADAPAAQDWCSRAGWHGVPLDESRGLEDPASRPGAVGFIALRASGQKQLAPDQARFLDLVRNELGIAFRGAQLRDALDRERALLSAILDGASEAIIAVDAERHVVRLNRAAQDLLASAEARQRAITCREALGCSTGRAAAIRGGTQPLRCGSRCPFEEVLGGAPSITDRAHTVVGRDRVEIPVSASYARMAGADAGAVAVLRDLRAANALEELRSSFVAAVSHELRTPLALISGYVDSLLGLELDASSQRRAVERIGQAAHRLTELVNDILDITHIESDRLALRREPSTIQAIVGRVEDELTDAAGMASLNVDIPSGLPRLDVDPVRVSHVIANLVDNATKYGSGRDGRITIAARRDGTMVVVSVIDEGEGIQRDERARVFERFYRGRSVRQSPTPGTGLGLYLCQRLVEAHGGSIWLDDRPRGTSVSFSLPVAASTRRPEAT